MAAIDRLARRASVLLRIWDDLDRAGIVIASVKERVDTSTPAGRLLRTLLAAVAEFERDNIVGRTTAGRNARGQQDGERGGRLPFGYRRTTDGIAVDEAAADAVRTIYRLAFGGASLRGITAALHERGLAPPGRTWHPSTVSTILTNETAYRGGARGVSLARWPAILEECPDARLRTSARPPVRGRVAR